MKIKLIIIFLLGFINVNAQNQVNEPIENFNAFWNLFHNNYAFFEDKNINWDSIGQVYRPQVKANTTDEQLFSTLCEMIKSLEDSHVNLIAEKLDTAFSAKKESRILNELKAFKNKRKAFKEMTTHTLRQNGFKSAQIIGKEMRGDHLFRYTNNSKVGYLRISRCFSNPITMKGWKLNGQLNQIFKSFEGMEAVIIDIRLNPGGTDGFSKAVAGKCTDKEVVGYHKQTRTSSTTFGELDTHYIKPNGKYRFTKPVYLLTNDKSVSAADVMSLMMAELENVIIMGERSNGSYSDIYAKKLPNKWVVTLSNQRYLSTSMENYEGTGTPVDIEVKNMRENFETKSDLVLLEALNQIN